ncbi:VCBS repeat-containing protein [Chryseobacterium sp. CFBP8996]|uniref:VCBS repeat-containing protein n=1 Tax=Chryseobacterium sp. CFBP8996 TaxID=3096529 RepID=UPI002A6A2F7A|nr:VCBS repeat-containing protein [Chryseobacterium sp. CFBP8996]MDY0932466.1 VCBS repeat-containing protein [Chryseobacterium sp. CFBP8996]
MIKNTILRRWRLYLFFTFFASFNFVSAQYGSADDFDGDGIINSLDLDDDNDGVPDAIESPSCFFIASEWNTGAKPTTNGVTISSGLTTTTGNFAQLLDGVAGVTAVTFSASPAQAIQNANVYLFTFTRAVKLDALYLKFNTLTQFGGTTKIQGSNTNNGSDWVDLSAAIGNATGPNVTANGAVSITNSMKYPVTLNTTVAYKYIRITGVAATNIVAQNASEVYFDFKNSAYVGSLYPKASCNVDTDSDGILNHFDRDSDGDTAPDAFESGATSNTAANYSFPNIDSNSDGLVDAVDPDGDGIPNYTSTYNPNAINNQISPFLTEICNDGIDNDGDGYVDMYDSDCNPAAVCASTKTVSNFQVQQQTCTSTGSYSNYQTPMVADIDRDGIPDLITFNDTGNSITVLNSTTLLPKFSIPNPDGTFGSRPNSLAVGQLDGSGYLEIAYVSSNTKLVVLRYNGTTWQSFISGTINSSVLSSGSYGSSGTAIADFDEDGTPEIYIGNQIFSVNFACGTSPCITNAINAMTVGAAVGNTGAAGGSFSYAYDVLPTSECSLCKGLEIVAGNQVYAVDVASGQVQLVRNYTGAPGANYDGPTAIADINLDGLLDVVVSNVNGSLYAWTPMTNQTVMSWTGGTGVQRPVPFIANVYNDDLADDGLINGSKVNYPEIIVLVGSTLTAYNVSGSAPIFTTPTSDTSAATSMVAFDFNGDGNKEIVYRDQTDLRIMYGGPMAYAPAGVGADRNYATFSCTSGTGWEHPVVADIDADGEAEIVGSCGTSICIFGSANFPWMPARPIWNQLSYNNVNVNDDGSIPVRQQNILASFNGANNQILNTFNTQLNPLELISPPGKIAAPDISVSGATITNLDPNGAANCSNLQIQYQIANTGSATMAKNIYVYVYDKDPRTQANASLIYQTVTNQNIPRNTSITQNLNFGIPSTSLPINKLYIAVNTNPYMTVLIDESDFTGSYPECSYTDNIFEFAFPGCSDIDGDGIIDLVDIDDDNDGIVDAVESPACFYTATEAMVAFKVSTGLTSSTVNSVSVTATDDIPTMRDNVSTTVAASNHVIAANQLGDTSKVIYKVQYPTAVSLTQMFVSTATSWGAGAFAVLEGSHDDVAYDAVSAPVSIAAGTPKVWPVTLNVNNLYRYYRIRLSTVGTTQPTFTNFEVTGTINPATYIPSANPKPINCTVDTDGDGIPNHQDLDSDGDGCPDLFEAGVVPLTDQFTPSSATNSSGGNWGITNLTGSQLNPTAADVNNDGLNDSVDPDLNSVPNYTSTYNQYAIANNLASCLDTDGDGVNNILDIDDDNDGVVDAVESPTCFYVANEWNTGAKPSYGVTISSALTTTGNFSQLIDGVSNVSAVTFSATPTQAIQNANVYLFNFISPVKLDALYLQFNTATQFGGTTKIQGSNTNNGSDWVDLSAAIAAGPTTNVTANGAVSITTSIKYPVTLNTATAYKYIRITGVAASNIVAANASEVYFDFNNASYVASSYPKPTCSNDTDGDGIMNQMDLDSDGDGCPDAVEAGVSANAGASASMSTSGGSIYTGGISSGTANAYVGNGTPAQYGANGFFNGIETAAESGLYNGTYTYNYAISNNWSACADTDGDGVPDLTDLDDDNDGILDAYESPDCYYSASDATSNATVKVSTALVSTVNSVAVVAGADIPTMHNGTISTVTSENHVFPASALASTSTVIYNVAYPLPVGLTQMVVNTNTPNWGTGYFAVLEGSTDNVSYSTLSTPLDISNNTGTLTANQKVWNVTLNTSNLYRYYRLRVSTKPAGNSVTFTNFEVTGIINMATYIPSANPKLTCTSDTDGDGLLNHHDLDRDGDGCPDAIEGGGPFTTANLVTSSINGGNSGASYTGTSTTPVKQNLGNTVGNTSTTMGVPTIADKGQTVNISDNKNYQSCTDFDGDGVSDFDDIDDDNDGVLDIIESPACFDIRNANDLFTITSGLTSPDDNQADNDIQALHNGSQTDFNFRFNNGQTYNNALIFMLDFQYAANLSAINIYSSGTWPASSGKLQGSNDKVTWTDLSAYQALTGATSPKVLNVTQNAGTYSYYRILGSGLETTSSVLISEVTTNANAPILSIAFPKPTCTNDADGDGVYNHQDLDSDGDGCPDAVESGTVAQAGAGNTSSGTLVNTSGTQTGVANAIIGNNTPSAYGANGFYNGIENNDTVSATYLGTYTYTNAINALVNNCSAACYKPAITAGTALDTHHGITSLQRAGTDNSNWPMVRKGAWTALESKTKAFVPNRLTITEINSIPAANLKEGMMVYNITSNCIYINTDGTATGWKCFNTQACP